MQYQTHFEVVEAVYGTTINTYYIVYNTHQDLIVEVNVQLAYLRVCVLLE